MTRAQDKKREKTGKNGKNQEKNRKKREKTGKTEKNGKLKKPIWQNDQSVWQQSDITNVSKRGLYR